MLQVVTLNIGGHRNHRDNPIEPAQIAREIKANLPLDYSRPTILALQENIVIAHPNHQAQDIGHLIAEEIGQGYSAYFAPKMSSYTHPHQNAWEKPSYAGATYAAEGNTILSNLMLAEWPWPTPAENFPGHEHYSPIVAPLGYPRLYSTGNRDTEPRNLFIAPFLYNDSPLYFMACHLSTLKGEDRKDSHHPLSLQAGQQRLIEIQQIIHLLEELRGAEKTYAKAPAPVILAGDFNVEAEREEMQVLQSKFTNLKLNSPSSIAYTNVKHALEIDHILLNDPQETLGKAVQVSIIDKLAVPDVLDHFPKIAVFP